MAKSRVPDPLDPWDRRPGESAPAYVAFRTYRDQGDGRTVRRVGRELHKNLTTIGQWSSRHDWVERCEAWDAYLDRERQRGHVNAVREMGERHAALALTVLTKASERLEALNALDLTPYQLARFVELGVKVEMLARGKADPDTPIVDPENAEWDEMLATMADDPEVQRLLVRLSALGGERLPDADD